MAMNNAGQPKLFRQADTALTEAAYRAGMATVPHDLSHVYERMANSYGRTMEATTEMWGKVIQEGGQILKVAADNFIERKQKENLASAYENANGVKFLIDGTDHTEEVENEDFDPTKPESETNSRTRMETTHVMGLEEIQQGLWQTYINKPFSKESIKERAELNQKKQAIYAQIEMLEGGFDALGKTLASGNYSKDAMKQRHGNAKLLAAIGAMHSKSGASENGDHIVTSHDKDGNLVLSLYGVDDDGNKVPVYKDGNPLMGQISVRADKLNTLITPNMPKVRKTISTLFDGFMQKGGARGAFNQRGIPSYDMNVEQKKLVNSLRDVFTDDAALQYAMFEDGFSHFQSSFAQDLTDKSYTSANLYKTLVEINGLNANKKPNVPTDAQGNPIIDISGGTDKTAFDEMDLAELGPGGVSQYATMIHAILNPESGNYNSELTGEIFIDWAKRKVTNESLAKQKLLPPINPWGANDIMKVKSKSGSNARKILRAVRSGNVDGLAFPERTKGSGSGIAKFYTGTDHNMTDDDGKKLDFGKNGAIVIADLEEEFIYYLNEDGVLPNSDVQAMMYDWQVIGSDVDQLTSRGAFSDVLWNANNRQGGQKTKDNPLGLKLGS